MSVLPTWARVVMTTAQPTNTETLRKAGFNASDVQNALDGGHIKRVPRGYESTFKGRRSLSVVRCDQIIAHCKATSSVASPPKGPPPEDYVPPVIHQREGSDLAAKLPSRGL